eukprot:1139959-Pelagomonas_calceolata.AAC.2
MFIVASPTNAQENGMKSYRYRRFCTDILAEICMLPLCRLQLLPRPRGTALDFNQVHVPLHDSPQGACSRSSADVGMSSASPKFWALELLSALEGLDRRNSFTQCVYSGQPISIKDFVVDLRRRHRSVGPTEDQAEYDEHPNKLAKYHNWVALPFRDSSAFGKPIHVPKKKKKIT